MLDDLHPNYKKALLALGLTASAAVLLSWYLSATEEERDEEASEEETERGEGVDRQRLTVSQRSN